MYVSKRRGKKINPDSVNGIGRSSKLVRSRAPFQIPGGPGVSAGTLSVAAQFLAPTRRPWRRWFSLRQAAGIGVTGTVYSCGGGTAIRKDAE